MRVEGSGFTVLSFRSRFGLGPRAEGLGFRIWGVGCGVSGSNVWGLALRVSGFEFRVFDFGL